GLPEAVVTDEQRLQQVLKNLLSNALKFTETGGVTLRMFGTADGRVGYEVSDTGIGIAPDALKVIFESFQQADGTTSRRYGGTGLGLSISREIARLLGGEIKVTSTPDEGSVFTLYLPLEAPVVEATVADVDLPLTRDTSSAIEFDPSVLLNSEPAVADDRGEIEDGDRVVLIVEDDEDFARVELDMARERGFKGIVATRGDEGLALAHEFRPDAIVLDMKLPVRDGWDVLDHLKRHPETRHIPVHIVSAGVENGGTQQALRAGAVAVIEKPVAAERLQAAFVEISEFVDRSVRRLLVVDDDEDQRSAIVELLLDDDIEITSVGSS